MKKTYLSLLMILTLSTVASAQRNIDVSLLRYYEIAQSGQFQPSDTIAPITTSTTIVFDSTGIQRIFLAFKIVNKGLTPTDTISVTDTFHLYGTAVSVAGPGINIGSDDTTGFLWIATMPIALDPGTYFSNNPWLDTALGRYYPYNWCDSIWFSSDVNDLNPINETGRMANNHNCDSVNLENLWRNFNTGIGGISIGGNGMLVSPNPSSGSMSILYDFGNNSSGIITITDVAGKTVYTQHLAANLSGLQTIPITTSHLPEGLYSLRLATRNKVAIQKIYIRN
jgi:hypothetical protein